MIRLLLILIFFKGILFGCSLCSIYSPKTHVTTQLKADKEYIKTLKVNWSFAKEFQEELFKIYDLNLNKSFEEKELKLIEESLIDYIKPKNFLTTISYSNEKNKNSLPFEVTNYKLSYKNSNLSFDYTIDLNYKIYDKNILTIKIFDDLSYFLIVFDEKRQLFNIPYKIFKSTDINEVSYTINAPNLSIQENIEEAKKEEIIAEKVEEKKEQIGVKNEQIKEENILDKFVNNIKKYLVDIENGDKFALIFLLMASFLYGSIHALGPGHGKALAFSYFSSQKSSYFEAFVISLVTAFVHIIGALILVLISIFVLESVLNRFMEDSISYVTAFCAIIIMLLALYILYRKLNKKSCSCCSCSVSLETTKFSVNPQNINFVKTSQNRPITVTKRNKKQDLIFVLTAGIIPCPGTVLLFVYAFLLKTYFAVILASISISLGMATVIFASSFLGVTLHKVSNKSQKFANILEIVAPIFMFILALVLLLNSKVF
ncbi:nickel/cobalt transporter [Arcobacter ellisii]|uniref:Nickel/cobalt efflux system n=1 Tax=Arcobacter ellisii TaxID=913109 RepID=A0A347UA86_9BACT|nr:DUF1007 family protein [Arcobacter ellisii]AXX95764.1 metal ion ABC transporter, permease protein [Arcobacter ellisii]RXI29132.1 sodium:proton antiporter [Arcobacter ellisii]